jgi:hypothetical protein
VGIGEKLNRSGEFHVNVDVVISSEDVATMMPRHLAISSECGHLKIEQLILLQRVDPS